MNVELHNATADDLPIIQNLWPCYMHDMSEHLGWACGADGKYDGVESVEPYFNEPRKHAFIFRAGDEPAGFALILADNAEPDVDYSVTDFFVLRKFRGQGVGQRIARELFDHFPGRWKVEQFAANKTAVEFWRKIIDQYARGNFIQSSGISQWGELNVLRFNTEKP